MQNDSHHSIVRPSVLLQKDQLTCYFAAMYHEHHLSVVRMAGEQTALVKANRASYDYYYDHLAEMPEDRREEVAPDICKIVKKIEAGAVQLNVARSSIHDAFCSAAMGKMAQLGASLKNTNLSLGAQYVRAISEFRKWRVAELDGNDVDLMPSLDKVRSYTKANADMFVRMFMAWADVAKPGVSIVKVRHEVLDHIASVRPGMTPNFLTALRPLETPTFGRKVPARVPAERVVEESQDCSIDA